MEYKTLTAQDAERFWALQDQLDHETDYMLYEPGERPKNLPEVEALLRDAESGRDFLLAAEENGALVGYLSAQTGRQRRIAHTAYVVVGILRAFRGRGVGTELFRRLDVWAAQRRLTRLELTVLCVNEPAVRLYLKSGFRIEGVRRKSIRRNGVDADEYYMARLLPTQPNRPKEIHPMRLTFRPAVPGDAALLVRLYDAAFHADYVRYGQCPGYGRSVSDMLGSLARTRKQLLLLDGEPVGVLSYNYEGEGLIYLGCLCVVPEHQGKGLGTRAFARLLALCPDWRRIRLITPADKTENLRFYTEKCGMTPGAVARDGVVDVVELTLTR